MLPCLDRGGVGGGGGSAVIGQNVGNGAVGGGSGGGQFGGQDGMFMGCALLWGCPPFSGASVPRYGLCALLWGCALPMGLCAPQPHTSLHPAQSNTENHRSPPSTPYSLHVPPGVLPPPTSHRPPIITPQPPSPHTPPPPPTDPNPKPEPDPGGGASRSLERGRVQPRLGVAITKGGRG